MIHPKYYTIFHAGNMGPGRWNQFMWQIVLQIVPSRCGLGFTSNKIGHLYSFEISILIVHFSIETMKPLIKGNPMTDKKTTIEKIKHDTDSVKTAIETIKTDLDKVGSKADKKSLDDAQTSLEKIKKGLDSEFGTKD